MALAAIGSHQAATAAESASETQSAEQNSTKTEQRRGFLSGLSVGGYGEVALSRNFYSDNVYRYSNAGKYKNDPSHGRFDIPHAVIYLNYEFGSGWRMGTEIEFEHTGTGVSFEKEYEESGEWEQEVEKGGEVELEQFWLEKTIKPWLNIRAGHIVVPVGLNNSAHEPLNFFTVYRPEGENTILPSTWHETGVSLWGRTKHWKYQLQFLPGLDAMNFSRDYWIQKGAHSAFEFKVANKYAGALRIDNYSVPGLRLGVSGYYGHSIDNTLGRDANGKASRLKGAVTIGSFDFTYNAHNTIVRGQVTYGHLGDAVEVYALPGRQSKTSPFSQDHVGKAAIATGVEAGYDFFSQIAQTRARRQKMYVFGRYEYYNSYIPEKNKEPEYPYTQRHRMAVGLNYFPIPQIVVKAEYSKRFLKAQYNDEPSISIGIAYQGFFK